MGLVVRALASALFGWLGSLVTAWIKKKEDERHGEEIQHTKDLEATKNEAADALKTETNVVRLDDPALDERLRKFARPAS
jgi:phage tail tape-measure protein